MAFTTPSTWVAGNVLTAAQLNQQVRDNVRFLHGPPMVRITRDASQSINNSTWTAISWDTEDWDTNTMWSSTAPTKVICRTAGKFEIDFQGGFASATGGTFRALGIRENTTAGNPHNYTNIIRQDMIGASQVMHLSGTIAMTTGQFIQAVQIHDRGSALGTSTSAAGERPVLTLRWVSS